MGALNKYGQKQIGLIIHQEHADAIEEIKQYILNKNKIHKRFLGNSEVIRLAIIGLRNNVRKAKEHEKEQSQNSTIGPVKV